MFGRKPAPFSAFAEAAKNQGEEPPEPDLLRIRAWENINRGWVDAYAAGETDFESMCRGICAVADTVPPPAGRMRGELSRDVMVGEAILAAARLPRPTIKTGRKSIPTHVQKMAVHLVEWGGLQGYPLSREGSASDKTAFDFAAEVFERMGFPGVTYRQAELWRQRHK